ncbi:MAG: hypothetical protein BWK80_38540 [Desulfobacteraceae bacterium IS3]|nr:MAG: hypothetical protein BWK80_38540 [Desulfobacteraceae bacterium IS3]
MCKQAIKSRITGKNRIIQVILLQGLSNAIDNEPLILNFQNRNGCILPYQARRNPDAKETALQSTGKD